MRVLKLLLPLLMVFGQLGAAETKPLTQRIAERKAIEATEISTVLSAEQQHIITLSALAANADWEHLKVAINAALDAGLSVNQVKEIMVHLYAYAGFPRSLLGLRTVIAVVDERQAKGVETVMGAEASVVTDKRPKYERGKDILEVLVQQELGSNQADYAEFAPIIEVFLKEHLFADIFERDVLTYGQRELVTVSVLAATAGVEPMLKTHLTLCLKWGYTPKQLQQFVEVIEKTVGEERAKAAQQVVDDVIKTNVP